ncbi:hypothetical protein FI667_g4759, partial [Globisporangium splendens]
MRTRSVAHSSASGRSSANSTRTESSSTHTNSSVDGGAQHNQQQQQANEERRSSDAVTRNDNERPEGVTKTAAISMREMATHRLRGAIALEAGDQKMEDPEGGGEDDAAMTQDKAEGSEVEDNDEECGSLISSDSDECSSMTSNSGSMDVDAEHQHHHHSARRWIHAIQNASFQPKPTAYSPQGSLGEDPLWEKQRECQDKLAVLRQVRARVQFYPIAGKNNVSLVGSAAPQRKTMNIQTRMIFSQIEEEDDGNRGDTSTQPTRDAHSFGIDTLSGLETLVFGYLTPNELIRASGVCRSWKGMARHDVIWEPRLFTPFERYPLREFLGLAADLPAMQVFMIFKRLRVSELPAEVGGGDNATRATGEMLLRHQIPAHRGRLLDERERFRTWMQAREDQQQQQPQQHQLDMTAPLDGNISRSTAVAPKHRQNPVECVHLVCFHGQTPTSDAYEWPTAATTHHLQDQFPALFATIRGRGERNDDEIHCFKDGYRRTTLKTWLQHQHTVSERVLRSFLRQMLVAITALEQAGVMHSDISTMTILVLEPADALEDADEKDGGDDDNETTGPIFQLLCSLNTWYCSRDLEVPYNNNTRERDGAQGDELQLDGPMMRRRRRDDDVAVVDIGGEDENAHDRVFNAMHAAVFGQMRQLRPPCMLTSVFRCAVSLYARGRFPDTTQSNSTTLLFLLSSQHIPLPTGFRACGEYAKFLLQTGSSSSSSSVAAQLLNHEYVATRTNAPNNMMIPIRPTNVQTRVLVNYQASILAWYGTLQAQVQAQAQATNDQSIALDHANLSLDTHLLDLMPRTRMGAAYLEHALEEDKLPSERFVSIVAPVVKESSWVRVLARSQRHTLQRLDLSNADLPTSVLLDELMNLPHITHLRLPSKIERPDDIEHFLAALSCRELLPNLRAMDENVQAAMDRMEKTEPDEPRGEDGEAVLDAVYSRQRLRVEREELVHREARAVAEHQEETARKVVRGLTFSTKRGSRTRSVTEETARRLHGEDAHEHTHLHARDLQQDELRIPPPGAVKLGHLVVLLRLATADLSVARMEKRSAVAERRRAGKSLGTAAHCHSNDDEESNQTQASEPVSKKSVGLHLEEPAPPQYEHKPEETDAGYKIICISASVASEVCIISNFSVYTPSRSEMAGSPVSVSSSRSGRSSTRLHKQPESIYDYLDTLETQSELQLQSASGLDSSLSSTRSRRMLPSHSRDYAWENDANDFAPRSISGGSPVPSYRSGASRANSDDKTKTTELLKMTRKKDKVKTKQLLQAEEAKWQAQLKETSSPTRYPDEGEAERFKLQLKDAKDRWATQERVRREQWIVKKTEEVKKSTIKALEPDIQAIRMEAALAKCQKEKEDVVHKYEAEFTALREQTSVECEQFKAQLTAKLRREFENDKLALEKQMLASRDAKIEVVIEKLQEESRAMLAKAEYKATAKFEAERKEWERELKQTSEIEGQTEELSSDAKRASDKAQELARLLHEERRQHETTVKQLEHRYAATQQDSEHSRQQMSAELTTLREKMETMAENFQTQKIQNDHDAELANLHERVRSTIARKDQAIENAQEELHLMHVKLSKSHALIEEQRMQLFRE